MEDDDSSVHSVQFAWMRVLRWPNPTPPKRCYIPHWNRNPTDNCMNTNPPTLDPEL